MSSDKYIDSFNRELAYLKRNDYMAYDPFDGLNSYLRPLTFGSKFLQIALQQSVRRLPFNIRPLVGIGKNRSTKGMAFAASGLLAIYKKTNEKQYLAEAESIMEWLLCNRSPFFKNYSWGNHFDYISRVFYLEKGMPTVVWTGLIGSVFAEFYRATRKDLYADALLKTASFIRDDLPNEEDAEGRCISYIPNQMKKVHNANVIGGAFLAEAKELVGFEDRGLAIEAMKYTAGCMLDSGAWYYGERGDMHWVDNFHTAYVLDSFKRYKDASGDTSFDETVKRGWTFYRKNFFTSEFIPKYYFDKVYPVDIQCASQSIETLVKFNDIDAALKVADWTIKNMQERDGHFSFRKYRISKNSTPMMHWGCGTMLSALGRLIEAS